MPVQLEQWVRDFNGHSDPPPHPCGGAEVLSDGRLKVTIPDTLAGRHAIAMIHDDLLDAVLWKGTVRLRVPKEGRGSETTESTVPGSGPVHRGG